MRRAAVAAVAGLALAGPATAAAQCPKTTLGAVESEVMCPVCGTSLALASEAPQADRQREFIVRLIERCKSKEEIKTALAAEFGDEVLSLPEAKGFDLAAYLVPALALLAAAATVGIAATRWRRRRPAAAAPDRPAPDADESARLERDLERYDL